MSQRNIGSAWNSFDLSLRVSVPLRHRSRGCKDWNIQQNLLGCASQEVVHNPAKGLVPQCTPPPPQDVISVQYLCVQGNMNVISTPTPNPKPYPRPMCADESNLCAQMRSVLNGPDLFFVDLDIYPVVSCLCVP